MALTLLDKVVLALEDKKHALCVFRDSSDCFDTLSRSILCDKLERYGISGVSLNCIKAYYENRSQCVCYDAVKSPIRGQN